MITYLKAAPTAPDAFSKPVPPLCVVQTFTHTRTYTRTHTHVLTYTRYEFVNRYFKRHSRHTYFIVQIK